MSSRRSLLVSGLAAIAVAAVILAGGFLSGNLVSPLQKNPGPSQSPTGSNVPPSTLGYGTLSVVLTDPPKVPAGVSAVYVSYNGVALHRFGSGNPGSWVNLSASGTAEAFSLVNSGLTITSAAVPVGTYDQVRMVITNVKVEYNGTEVTTFSGQQYVSSIIPGSLNVYSSSRVTIVFDLQTSILNLNTASSPKFVFSASAWSAQVPVQAQVASEEKEGQTTNLSSQSWWPEFEKIYTAHMAITSATLTNDSLSVTVENTGNSTIDLNLVTLSQFSLGISYPITSPNLIGVPITNSTNSSDDIESIPAFGSAAVFVVLPNGTLAPISAFAVSEAGDTSTLQPYPILNPHSYALHPGDNVTLSYTGPILFYSGGSEGGTKYIPNISPSNTFIITVIGNTAVASISVHPS